ncbi:MAG: hypothetical protein HC905_22665 [Bacteroidales bacterium]|nr:hypothetical protein [Bacteroidales bacterium]
MSVIPGGKIPSGEMTPYYIQIMSCTNCSFNKTSPLNDADISLAEMLGGKTSYDWLNNIPDNSDTDLVEIRFKNNRKDFL